MITLQNLIQASIAYCLANPTVRHRITERQIQLAGVTQAELCQLCAHAGVRTSFQDGGWVLWGGIEAMNGHETNTPQTQETTP